MSANVLNGWKEVAACVGRGVRTVQRWERELGFPVHRPGGKHRSAVIAIKSEIDSWLQTPHRQAVSAMGEILTANTTALNQYYDFVKRQLNRTRDISSILKVSSETSRAQKLTTDVLRSQCRLRLDLLQKETARARSLVMCIQAFNKERFARQGERILYQTAEPELRPKKPASVRPAIGRERRPSS